MREIKFRAWDKKQKKMFIFGEWWKIDDINSEGLIFMPEEWGLDREDGDKKDFELMQFTGLKDKNGKEIYEGDIVDFKFGGSIGYYQGKITWEGEGFYIVFGDKNICGIRGREIEVIGNIYENPELKRGEA